MSVGDLLIKKRLRHMTINDREYLWNYFYDDMDFASYPYSYYLFIPKCNPKLKIRVYFTKYAPPMRLVPDKGTDCFCRGKQAVLNLNRPYFARQMLEYIFQNYCRETDIGEIEIKDGEAVLERIGYSDFYQGMGK